MVKFPQELDSDEELHLVVDDETAILAAHHNALKDAIKALEEKVGVDLSAVEESLDYIVKQLSIKSIPEEVDDKRVTNIFWDASKGQYQIQREE